MRDGAQLQPVEAGPAFRLVTTRLGKVELNTVLRQKEEWQKEATVLFGQQKTAEAIKTYAEREYVHIVDEKLPPAKIPEDFVKRYEISHRVSSLIYREMIKEAQVENPQVSNLYSLIRDHQDFASYVHWKGIEKKAAQYILKNAEDCRPILEERCLNPLKVALTLADKTQPKNIQQKEAKELLKECKLDHLIGVERPAGTGVEVREQAKEELIQAWHATFKEVPEKSALMLAYSNKDVNDLNQSARSLLKASGQISQTEFTYTTKKEVEDDFGRIHILKKEKGFSKGDRIVFTKNKYGLGIRNGTMGTITELDGQKIQVQLDGDKKILGKNLSFSPNLNPYFDHGWAITTHKSQGTTVDRTFVLASFEMSQNLAYVAMTRHQEWAKVFGSSLDFWRPEKLPQVLSKSGEKLSAGDYLDAESLSQLMKKDDLLITKLFQRMSNELEAMGAVTKQAFWNVADHFLGIRQEKEIRILPESVREEVRAEQLFHQKRDQERISHLHEDHLHLDFNPSPQKEDNQRKRDLFIQKDPQQRMIAIPLPSKQKLEEKSNQKSFWQMIKASFKSERIKGETPQVSFSSSMFPKKRAPSFSQTSATFEKEMLPQPKNAKKYYMTAELKKEILGETFYQKTTIKSASHKAPQMISEEIKREMLGDKFYNQSYKKPQTSNMREIEKLSRMYVHSHIAEEHTHHEQDISLSQKPSSRGKRR